MEEISANDNRPVANSTFKDILISPNNDDVIIPISATFDKAVLHIGIGNGCGIFIEKFGVKNGKELKTSVQYATRKFTDARKQRKNKGKDLKASSSEDIEKIVDESGERFTSGIPSMKEIDRQMAKLLDHLLVQETTENKSGIDTIPDTKPLKESKSVDIESDIGAADKSIRSIIGTVLSSDIRSDVQGKPMHDKEIALEEKTLVESDMNNHLYKLNETRFNAERTTSFEAIDKAYQEEMLQIAIEKEPGVYKPNCIRSSTETGFPLTGDMYVYMDEIFVTSKRDSQMIDEYVSATTKKTRKDKQQEYISESGTTSEIVVIDKDYTDSNVFDDVLDKGQSGPNLDDSIVDRAPNDSENLDAIVPDTFAVESDLSMSINKVAVDEMSDSDTLAGILNRESGTEIVEIIESDDDIVDIDAIALQDDQDEVGITAARNETDNTYITINNVVDDDDNLFGIMDIYIKSDLHFDLHNIQASTEHCGQKKDFGY
ncbi:uncharacterized protein LOC132740291 [Ruditapes philippinarum]|uniref:uncharacterized protein LOC132740291 n=1 Tax=Ruditapes philippinarum TaxID=129788 RepID=UPI00295AED75|nr:uncharacterized protein LOC132740291 [Ruditapes philippinarum]